MNEHNENHGHSHVENSFEDKQAHATPGHDHHAHHPQQQGKLNPWMITTLILAGLVVGYGASNFVSSQSPTNGATQPLADTQKAADAGAQATPAAVLTEEQTKALPDDDTVIGSASASVTIVEFSDYQCPYCLAFHDDSYTQLKKDYIDTGKVKFIYRDYPLASHPQALGSSHASECADDQGKFAEMHEMLFDKQREWSGNEKALDLFAKYAKNLGLDGAKFDDCMKNQKFIPEIRKDLLDGLAVGVKGTPHFFINGHRIPGAMDYDTIFKPAIEAELNHQNWQISGDPLTGAPFVEIK